MRPSVCRACMRASVCVCVRVCAYTWRLLASGRGSIQYSTSSSCLKNCDGCSDKQLNIGFGVGVYVSHFCIRHDVFTTCMLSRTLLHDCAPMYVRMCACVPPSDSCIDVSTY